MNNYDNMMLFQLYGELDKVVQQQKILRKYRDVPQGSTLEEALMELEEEEYYIRMKIDELSIVQSDFFDEEF